tara:strand:+ start:33044 stop:33526 length:483 start_codon:yes stop_codon:yes gene_type:complete
MHLTKKNRIELLYFIGIYLFILVSAVPLLYVTNYIAPYADLTNAPTAEIVLYTLKIIGILVSPLVLLYLFSKMASIQKLTIHDGLILIIPSMYIMAFFIPSAVTANASSIEMLQYAAKVSGSFITSLGLYYYHDKLPDNLKIDTLILVCMVLYLPYFIYW